VDDEVHLATVARAVVCLPVCRVNVTLFSRVTLIRKLQSTSDLDHLHARPRPYSHVKSRDNLISGRRVLYPFIYID